MLIFVGIYWFGILCCGFVLCIVDVDGGVNLFVVFYCQEDLFECYNMVDMLKVQYIVYFMCGYVLYMDMGCVIVLIMVDMFGWYDLFGGVGDVWLFVYKYGVLLYQVDCNVMICNGWDSFVFEFVKYGLLVCDFVVNVNFFSKLDMCDDGVFDFVFGYLLVGSVFDLCFEMNMFVVFLIVLYLFDLCLDYVFKVVKLIVYCVYLVDGVVFDDDLCWCVCVENMCGFVNIDCLFV